MDVGGCGGVGKEFVPIGGVEVQPGGEAGGVGGVEEVRGGVPCLPDFMGNAGGGWRGFRVRGIGWGGSRRRGGGKVAVEDEAEAEEGNEPPGGGGDGHRPWWKVVEGKKIGMCWCREIGNRGIAGISIG